MTTSASFDFNTSLTMDTTDPNGEQTTINTRDEVLRPTLTTFPTGATASASFDDDEPSESHSVTYADGGTSKTTGTAPGSGVQFAIRLRPRARLTPMTISGDL